MTRARMPSVDVIITGHNCARWLGESIASVYAQTRRDYTLTVVDDGSADETASVADRWLRQAPDGIQRRLLRTPDLGPSRARHEAIRHSTSPYFLYLDGDDMIAPVALERHVPVLNRHHRAAFSYSDRRVFGEINRVSREILFDLSGLKETNYVGGGVLVRRTAYDEVGGFRKDNWGYAEDWDLWLDIAEAGWKWRHVPEPLFLYRHHMATSLSFFIIHLREAYRALRYFHHPRLYAPSQLRWARRILRGMPSGWNRRPPFRTVEDCERGLLANPGNAHLLFLVAMAHIRNGQFPRAIRRLVEVQRVDPEDPHARIVLAVLRSVKTRETVRLDHERVSMQEALCRLFLLHGEGIQVGIPAKVLQAAGRIRPRTLQLDALMVRFREERLERMRHDVVRRLLNDAADSDFRPRSANRSEVYLVQNVASRYQSEGAHDDARILFQLLLDMLLKSRHRGQAFDAEIGSCYFHLGEIAFDATELTDARRLFSQCVEYIPAHRTARRRLATIANGKRRVVTASGPA